MKFNMGGETKRMVYHCQNGPLPLSINPIPQLVLLYNHHHQNTINLSYSTCKLLQFGFSFVNILFSPSLVGFRTNHQIPTDPKYSWKVRPFFLMLFLGAVLQKICVIVSLPFHHYYSRRICLSIASFHRIYR